MPILAILAALATLTACASHADPPSQEEPRHVPGELIVGFHAGSDANQAVSAAMAGGLVADPAMDEYVAALSERLGLPCAVRQITSGGEILLVVDEEALAASIAAAAAAKAGVEAAEARAAAAPTRFGPGQEVTVRFGAESGAGEALATAAGAEPPPAVREWISELGGELGLELRGKAADGGLVLTVDLGWATKELMQRLREQPEVAFVELNQLLQIQ